MIVNYSPAGLPFSKQQREGAVWFIIRAFQTPAPKDQCSVHAWKNPAEPREWCQGTIDRSTTSPNPATASRSVRGRVSAGLVRSQATVWESCSIDGVLGARHVIPKDCPGRR